MLKKQDNCSVSVEPQGNKTKIKIALKGHKKLSILDTHDQYFIDTEIKSMILALRRSLGLPKLSSRYLRLI